MRWLKGLAMLAVLWALLILGLGLGGCAIPTSGPLTATEVQEP